MHKFCTYFDKNYLLRGIAMFRSLKESGIPFSLDVLALDKETDEVIRAINCPELNSIPLSEMENNFPELSAAKGNRTLIEYYFTLSPCLPLYIFERNPEIQRITYVDADLIFYSSPEPLFQELGTSSIQICEHRYSPLLRDRDQYGRFVVQYQTFRRTTTGMRCLQRWKSQCLEWCQDKPDGGRYADQKYLDEWPELYGKELSIIQNLGAGVAPWNWSTFPVTRKAGKIHIQNSPLVFYHFHGLKIFSPHFISNGLADWTRMPWRMQRFLYAGYVRRLREASAWIRSRSGYAIRMKDHSIRRKTLRISDLKEIASKAWRQAMFVP